MSDEEKSPRPVESETSEMEVTEGIGIDGSPEDSTALPEKPADSSEDVHMAEDGGEHEADADAESESVVMSAEELAGATTMYGEDGTHYIIVMDESAPEGGAVISEGSVALTEDGEAVVIQSMPEGKEDVEGQEEEGLTVVEDGEEEGKESGTVFVMEDEHGNYQVVNAPVHENLEDEGATILINEGDEGSGIVSGNQVQYLVDEEGNIFVDEEGNPVQMAVTPDENAGEELEAAPGEQPLQVVDEERSYVIVEDEHGTQMYVDASSLMGATDADEEGEGTAVMVGVEDDSEDAPPVKKLKSDVFTRKLPEPVAPAGGRRKSIGTEPEPEPEIDWTKIDPEKLTFALRYGCCFCKWKSFKDINDLKKHRKECTEREKFACEGCTPKALKEQERKLAEKAKRSSSSRDPDSVPKGRKKVQLGASNKSNASVHGSALGGASAARNSSNPLRSSSPSSVTPSSSRPELKCRVCSKTFATCELLKIHLINVHLGASAFTATQTAAPDNGGGGVLGFHPGQETVQLIASSSWA